MTCSTCPRPATYKGPPAECQACRRKRRYHEDPDFRRKVIDSANASHRRRRHKQAQELRELRAYRAAVEETLAEWDSPACYYEPAHLMLSDLQEATR
jgi:hypothetical protein